MANQAGQAARRSRPLTGEPPTRYDAKCREWDGYYVLGPAPTTAALTEPGSWQAVYELRPLELIAYWLGIPFRPYHPVSAVIYDDVNRGYYTAPACRIAELGHPTRIPGTVPFARLVDLSGDIDRLLRRGSDLLWSGFAALSGCFMKASERFDAWLHPSFPRIPARVIRERR